VLLSVNSRLMSARGAISDLGLVSWINSLLGWDHRWPGLGCVHGTSPPTDRAGCSNWQFKRFRNFTTALPLRQHLVAADDHVGILEVLTTVVDQNRPSNPCWVYVRSADDRKFLLRPPRSEEAHRGQIFEAGHPFPVTLRMARRIASVGPPITRDRMLRSIPIWAPSTGRRNSSARRIIIP